MDALSVRQTCVLLLSCVEQQLLCMLKFLSCHTPQSEEIGGLVNLA